jgi:hypothetical protein
MPAATYSDLAALLGRNVTTIQGNAVIQNVTAMVKGYTRGAGFVDGVPNDELRAVILSASCRVIANPRGIEITEAVGPQSASFRGAFTGWTVAETFCLNRYRKRAE